MSGLMADVIGILGSMLFIGGFAYANMTKELNKLWFNIANLAGAILLLVSLSVNFNLAAVVLEIAWGLIAMVGIYSALKARKHPYPPTNQ